MLVKGPQVSFVLKEIIRLKQLITFAPQRIDIVLRSMKNIIDAFHVKFMHHCPHLKALFATEAS